MVVTIASTIEPIKADRKPATTKPGTRKPTNKIINALITNKNNPKLKIVKGKVKITKIGRTIALTNPKIMAAIAAVVQLSNLNPGTMWAVINSAIAVTNQVNKKFGIITVFIQV
jgi:hypothetical protein